MLLTLEAEAPCVLEGSLVYRKGAVSMHNSGLRAFGFALAAVVGLLALFAAAAQAENLSNGGTAGKFEVLGLSALVLGTLAVERQEGSGRLSFPSLNIYIKCENSAALEIKGISSSEFSVEVLFSECRVFLESPNEEIRVCKIKEEMITASAIAKAKLHEGEPFILFEGGKKNGAFASILFTPSEGTCPLGLKEALIKGSVVALVDNGEEKREHLLTFNGAIQELFQVFNPETKTTSGDMLLFGARQTFLEGSAITELAAAHSLCGWSVV